MIKWVRFGVHRKLYFEVYIESKSEYWSRRLESNYILKWTLFLNNPLLVTLPMNMKINFNSFETSFKYAAPFFSFLMQDFNK